MKIFETLVEQLSQENNFVSDNGKIKKWVVLDKARSFDEELIGLLLDNKVLKQEFFKEIKDTLVFDLNRFVLFLEQKNYLNDSFTKYKNKVGLSIDGKFLKQRNEVSLVWPFKDCVLEGGQSREEDKREEIFFNEVLAQDEITQLFEPKVLTNAKVYDKDGEHEFEGFTRDANINKERGLPENTITDNLIIKGNNLLALHSLEEEFAGKVKLIYIDPPFNTGNDSFQYNDSFNHSTWLTFMKNRLGEARKLLSKDGAIFIHLDDAEISYLNVLLQELMGADNFLFISTVTRSAATGHKAINPTPVKTSEFILAFAKDKTSWKYHTQYVERGYDFAYKQYIANFEEGYENWEFKPLKDVLKEKNLTIDKALKLFPEKISRLAAPDLKKISKEMRELIIASKSTPKKVYLLEREKYSDIYIVNGERVLFYKNKMKDIDGKFVTAEALTNVWTDIPFQGIAKEGGVKLLKGKKPEKLLRRIIDMSTKEGDLVLDYHLGSGTTASVAHKMGRQYIGIEQLDYGNNDSVVRLQNVVNGDKSGISKAVQWTGGDSFTYLELKKHNQVFIEQIEEAKDTKALLKIWSNMKEKSFLDYNVDIKKHDENIEDFKALELDEQKQHLCEILDKNQLYVNISSLGDKEFACTDDEKKLTHDFYKIKT